MYKLDFHHTHTRSSPDCSPQRPAVQGAAQKNLRLNQIFYYNFLLASVIALCPCAADLNAVNHHALFVLKPLIY